MEEEERSCGERLRRWVLSQIEERGPIPFSQFMEWCLYHPEDGYYRSERMRIGRDGDFYTGPCVHPLFGGLIAKQLSQISEELGGTFFDIAEQGAGKGFLCEDILQWARQKSPAFYERIRYHLIEPSLPLLEEQKERLVEYQKEGKVFWIDPETFERGEAPIEGCFLSNELVDSFPVHQVLVDRGILKEVYVTQDQGQLKEQKGELSDSRIASYFQSSGVALQEGQRAEVNLMALDWIEKVAQCLKKGFVLTIDYGYLAKELYGSHRREGTLLCYYKHRTSQNPYERLGAQDITSHVNFSGLIEKGEEVGLHLTGFVPQYQFLLALGLLEEMEFLAGGMSEMDGLRMRLSLKHLIEPEMGMGEVFKVLIQHKGIELSQLDGLRALSSIPGPISGEGAGI
jgi:SAM-dependent MidA family methyltransferase